MYARTYEVTFEPPQHGMFTVKNVQAKNESSAIKKAVLRANKILEPVAKRMGDKFEPVSNEDVAAVEQSIY